jgi:phosphoglycolate phosphatase-like HAD superfamily hydrolase
MELKGILFDLDGVITSERIYWNCSGLAYAKYLGMDMPEEQKGKIELAQKVLGDETIRRFKEAGINSNWDITYIMSVLSDSDMSVDKFQEELNRRGLKGVEYLKLLDEIDPSQKHDREGGPWKKAHEKFQKCYYELESTDSPVIPIDHIKNALDGLKAKGVKLGIVTGRPYEEAKKPLEKWGLWDYFEKGMIVTEDEVAEESKKEGRHIGKPDPWPILRAISAEKGCENCGRVGEYLFVGDSTSDVLAAKNAGMRIICVNTGIASEKSLRDAGADWVVEDVGKVPEVVETL